MAESRGESQGGDIDLIIVWDAVLTRIWMIVAITILATGAAASYAFLATEWYRASVVLIQAEGSSSDFQALGGLAALAGVNIGSNATGEAMAVLRSDDLAREFIEKHGLMRTLLQHRWDVDAGRWRSEESKWPDVRDAIAFFSENVRKVRQDFSAGVVTLSMDWTDPEQAAEWANDYVRLVNDSMRSRALEEAEGNVEYLTERLSQTTIVPLQQSISRLLETELQKVMLAAGNEQFAFKVVDPANVPKDSIHPKRLLIVAAGMVIGLLLGIFLAGVLHVHRKVQAQ